MKIDENKEATPDSVSSGEGQNRREFFNGLGKWSMIVVAAVSFLRGSLRQAHAGRDGTQRLEWEPRENVSQRLAKKKHHQHVDIGTGHIDTPHQDVQHVDYKLQPGMGQRPGQTPTRISE